MWGLGMGGSDERCEIKGRRGVALTTSPHRARRVVRKRGVRMASSCG